jgi:hypothetical protein
MSLRPSTLRKKTHPPHPPAPFQVPAHIRAQISFLRAWCLLDVIAAIDAEKKDPRFAIVMKVGNMSAQKSDDGYFTFQVQEWPDWAATSCAFHPATQPGALTH